MSPRPLRLLCLLFLALLLVSACGAVGDAAPVVKIGLIAPFEGLGRPLGYSLLPEIQDAITDANTGGGAGPYRIALVALNDESYGPEAEAQARALALDPDVVAVLGPWTAATLEEAAFILADGGLTVVSSAPVAPLTGVANVCPTVDELARTLLDRAAIEGQEIVIAGPENALTAALGASESGAIRLPWDSAPPEAPGDSAVVIHTGDAETATIDLQRWRAAGWRGLLIGGPDMAQLWFGDLGKPYAEGTWALVCGPATGQGGEHSPSEAAAREAVSTALNAIQRAIGDTGRPTRAAVAQALAETPPTPQAHWLRYASDGWRAPPKTPNP